MKYLTLIVLIFINYLALSNKPPSFSPMFDFNLLPRFAIDTSVLPVVVPSINNH